MREGDRAGGVEVGGGDVDVLGDRAIGRAGDGRGFVGAGDGVCKQLAAYEVVMGLEFRRMLFRPLLAGGQVVGGVVGNLEGPADGAAVAGVDVGAVEREGAEIAVIPRDVGRSMGVGGVDIREGDRAAGVEVAGGDVDVLGDRAIGRAGDGRGFVGAGDGDCYVLGVGPPRSALFPYTTLFRSLLAGGQVVGGVVGNLEGPADGAAVAGVDVGTVE